LVGTIPKIASSRLPLFWLAFELGFLGRDAVPAPRTRQSRPEQPSSSACRQASNFSVSSGWLRCREGGSPALLAGCTGNVDATSCTVQGEPLPQHLPCLPAHIVLTYSCLACPWSQASDRRNANGQRVDGRLSRPGVDRPAKVNRWGAGTSGWRFASRRGEDTDRCGH
jgi:hypothetical protein